MSYAKMNGIAPANPALTLVDGFAEVQDASTMVILTLSSDEAMELFNRALNSQLDDSAASASAIRKLAEVLGNV